MYEQMKEWGDVVLRAAVIVCILFFIFWPMRVEGRSMAPSLNDGDIVFSSRLFTQQGWYDNGDLVLFSYRDEGRAHVLVKRVIASAGERVRIDEAGDIYIDEELLEEEYCVGATKGIVDMRIPEGYVFVLGDNREESIDSRQLGLISTKDLTGRVLFRLYPFGEMGVVS